MSIPVCWSPSKVREVINTDAESVPDAVFRAVHTDWQLFVARPQGTSFQQLHEAAYAQRTAQDLLADFLNNGRHMQLAVIGRSGSGKSHLIHWMRMHIPVSAKRLTIVIPKAGTSLRSVLQLIIKNLPREAQKPFLEELERTGEATATRSGQKERLLNEIAQAIREDVVRTSQGEDTEVEEELIRALPHVFQDPFLRERYFLQENSIVASIVNHVFSAPSIYERAEVRRAFTVDDLPTGGSDFKDASRQARDAISTIYIDEDRYKPLAIDLINRNLNVAISRTLSFSGDRLMQLMISLRRHLKSEGKELVLLIEDFARLQGIDRALLQSLLTQGDDEICDVRWAIAVTTGFFESIAETVYTRMTYFVEMDRSSTGRSSIDANRQTLVDFSGRYLNAVRLGLPRVEGWFATIAPDDVAPNACDDCLAQSECHSAFGRSVDGHGLYPFTAIALAEMVHRTDDRAGTGFNPRVLQNAVIGSVLENYAVALEEGLYPPITLLNELGGFRHLSALDRQKITNQVPDGGDRLIAALEIYNADGLLKGLPEALRKALKLPALPSQIAAPAIADGNATKGSNTSAIDLPTVTVSVDPEQAALEDWGRGKTIPQGLAAKLRPLLYGLICDSIDWDAVGLERSFHVGGAAQKKAFRPTSISFERQETAVGVAPVKIVVSASDRVVMALQGLLQSNKQGGEWEFATGMEKLAALLDGLFAWKTDVVEHLNAIHKKSADWNPVCAAAELLVIGSALGVRSKQDAGYDEQLGAMFSPWPADAPGAVSPGLTNLYKKIEKKRSALRSYVRATTHAGKGGVSGAIFDSRDCIEAIRRLRRLNWQLSQIPPRESSVLTDVQDICDLYKEIASALPVAASEERETRLSWLTQVRETLGEEPKRSAILESLTRAFDVAQASGMSKNRSHQAMEGALSDFASVQFDDAVASVLALEKQSDAVASIPLYARGRSNAVQATSNLINAATNFLGDVEGTLNVWNRGLDNSDQLDQAMASIRRSLTALSALEVDLREKDATY
ncbi:protein DpdH [Variovorax sp. RB2P76]|uniref:protein DpdH n=1 Tax=Variovorax sp. RB2P76 TaxID=3443736 RepID=UPI003F450047